MHQRFLQRFALFFSLLLCLQQAHPYILRSERLSLMGNKNEKENDEFQGEEETGIQTANNGHKRIIGIIATGILITTMLAGLGVDIFVYIRGCCDISEVCDLKKRYDNDYAKFKKRGADIDRNYAAAENIRTYVNSLDTHLQVLWINVKRLDQSQKNLIEALDPDVINKLINASAALKIAIRDEKNETINSFTDIETMFTSAFDSGLSTLVRMVGFIGLGLYGLFAVIKWYYQRAKTQLIFQYSDKAVAAGIKPTKKSRLLKFLGVKFDSASVSAKNTKIARSVSRKSVSKGKLVKSAVLKITKVASFALSVAFEVWRVTETVKQCNALEENAKNQLKSMTDLVLKFDEMDSDVAELKTNATKSYEFLKNQIVDTKFMDFTKNFINATKNSDNQDETIQNATKYSQKFIDTIKSADKASTIKLVKSLSAAFSSVTFKIDCHVKKINSLNFIYKECSAGRDNFGNLFKSAQESYRAASKICVAVGYMTEESARSFINEKLQRNQLQSDCILNNDLKLNAACSRSVLLSESNKQIETSLDLSAAQVQNFLGRCSLFPLVKNDVVCSLKWEGKKTLEEVKKSFSKFIPKTVEDAYNNCPKKICNDLLKKSICNAKERGTPLNQILSNNPIFQVKCMTDTFNTCKTKIITDPENRVDLTAVCAIIGLLPLTNPIFVGYKATYGLSALQALKNGLGKPEDSCAKQGKDTLLAHMEGQHSRFETFADESEDE